MRRFYFSVLVVLALATTLVAQDPTVLGTISSTTCPGSGCVRLANMQNREMATVEVSGTWTGILRAEITASAALVPIYNAATKASVGSITANGVYQVPMQGASFIQIRATSLSAGSASVRLTAGQGSADWVLPDGAATQATLLDIKNMMPSTLALSANQPQLGIAGSPGATVVTVQGIASMTPLSTSGSQVITDGSAAGQADVIASAPSGLEQGLVVRPINSGTQTVAGSVSSKVIDGTATGEADVLGGNPAGVEQGLVVRNIPSGTQPVSAASLPLPSGAATESTLFSIDSKTPALVSGRQPVDGSGVTQPVSAAALPLPTGAATAAKQPALGTAGTPSADVISVQEPSNAGQGTIDRAVDDASYEIPLAGVKGLVFRIQGLGGGAVVRFEVKSPGSTLWSFLAGFNMANAAGTNFTNDFEIGTSADGTWIATGKSGFDRMRIRVETPGTAGSLTVDWATNADNEYAFVQAFGDLKDNTGSAAHAVWPLIGGGIAYSALGAANPTLANLPAARANDVRSAFLTSAYRELLVQQMDHHLPGTIDATGETVGIATMGAQGVSIHIRGTWNPGAGNYLAFQMSDDGVNYTAAVGYGVELFTGAFETQSGTAGTANANGTWRLALANGAAYVRVIHTDADGVPSAWSSGSATVTIRTVNAPPIQASYIFGDKAHGSPDFSTAPVKQGCRTTTSGQTAVANDARANIPCDDYGVVYQRPDHPQRFSCTMTSTATTSTIITGCTGAGGTTTASPGAGLRRYITDFTYNSSIISTTANFMTLQTGTGATCGTGTVVIHRASNSAAFQQVPESFRSPLFTAAAVDLCFLHPGAGTRQITINGFIAP